MDVNSPIIDSEEDTAFDVPMLNKIKLFDVFDDPPLISDDKEGPLKIDIPNPIADEDDESLGYDSIFKSRMEHTKKIESYADENDDRDDYGVTLTAEEEVIGTKEMEQDDLPVNDKDGLSEGDEQAPVDLDLTVNDTDKDSEGPVKKVYDISSDSSVGEENGGENHHPEVTFDEEEEVEVPTHNEIFGRWTCSGGAAKKTISTTSSGSKKPATVYEREKFAVHSESQRLIRETNLELLHYKPKEYTSVAEFKKALHGDKTGPLSRLRPSGTQAIKATSPLNEAQASTSHSLRNFNLPDNLPPPKPLQANDDDIIDLLQDDQPVILGKRSQADELISRFNKFAKPAKHKDNDPITKTQEFSILTKVADAESGTVSLKLDSVKYKSTTKQSLTFTNRREWAKHRAELKEIMREKKLKQYEERMKEYKPSQYSEMSGDRNEDEDWVEEDEESFSSDCSTSLESEEEDEEQEEDDEAPHVKRRSKNPFLDDEAAEDDDGVEGGSKDEDEDDNDVTMDDVDEFIAEGRPTIRPIHNGHLEPGDVDLFASDSITQSVPSQNRTLSDRSWNATPYSLLFSQKQPSGSTTDSSSLEQTKIEYTLPTTTQTQVLKTQDPVQRMTALDDYSVVKVELNLTQFDSGGSKGLTEGPTQTQLIDDFEDIDPTQPNTVPLPSVDESDKPKLVRIRDATTASTVKDSHIIHPSAQSTQLVSLNIVDLDFTQNVDFGANQTQVLELTVPLSKDKLAAEEITRPKLTRVRDALNAPITNEAESLPDIRELPSEEHDLREMSVPKMDLLDPSYIQCSFATQAVDEPREWSPIEESHKPRKRLRHNSGDDSDGNEEASLHPKRRATIEQSAQPLEEIETIAGEIERVNSGSAPVMEVEEDSEANKVEEEGDDDGERLGEVDSEEEEEEGVENEAEEEYSSGDDEEKEYFKMIQSQIEDKKLEKKHPRFRPAEFIDEEAELSGDEEERAIYGDERDEDLDDEDDAASLKDFVDENEIDDRTGKLRREVERVYNRIQEDDDQRKLRYLKEMFFEDGDLYDEEGRARRRRFKWKGLDDEDPFPLGGKRVDFGAEEGDEEESGISPLGAAGFMSRELLQGVVVEEVALADNLDAIPKDGSSQATENASEDTSAADDTQNTLDYSESLLSALGKKVIFRQQSVSLTFKSPKKRWVIDVRQKTLPGMLLRSSSTNDVPLLEKPTLLSKHGSLLSRPAPVLPVPASSRSLMPQSRQFSPDMEMDNDVENDPGVTNRGQADTTAFGLRTKVGLSCFSTRMNSDVTPITNRSHFIKPATAQPVKGVSNLGSTFAVVSNGEKV
ncbi:unnamed protein product [Hymenolepis diminuta]|uniref:Claspin n=1 Tax=Hymenolepis diminuta TaxID=6216 RepID=A0A0R3SAN0_HYMDI|nr:unnamed protein product [Hymenolepis diminuta]